MISSTIFAIVLLIFFTSLLAKGQNDFSCLREFKSSISDPTGHLSSWNFDDTSVGAVCSFTGVNCWNPNENRILSITLSSSSLSGTIPSALRLCSSLTYLDLSVNNFSGPIPSSLCSWLPYLATLDLSSNSLTGPIPPHLFNCKFLNSLILSGNHLSGSIPATVSNLGRLEKLDLSVNDFSGPIPSSLCSWLPYLVTLDLSSNNLTGPIPPHLFNCKFLNSLILSGNYLSGSIPATVSNLGRLQKIDLSSNNLVGQIPSALALYDSSSFANNPFLCGQPLSPDCRGYDYVMPASTILTFLGFGFSGFICSLTISYVVWSFCFATEVVVAPTKKKKKKKNKKKPWLDEWPLAGQLTSADDRRLTVVSLFQKPIRKLILKDLIVATANFHPNYTVVCGSSSIGTSYEAVLRDGSSLIVKRLHDCSLSERQFRAEMDKIGQIGRHPNLVPLLGFCIVDEHEGRERSFFGGRKRNVCTCFGTEKKILKPHTVDIQEERILIYKKMPNGALSLLLQSRDESLDWKTRLRIGIGVARGLAWLHHGFQFPLLHHSLCSNAVLLDEDYEPKITEFGLARLFRQSVDDGVLDTSPLLNAELATTKEDVYDFGVILLELGTGRCVVDVDCDALVDWVARELYAGGQTYQAIDISLRGKGNDDDIVEFLKIACGCVVDRPHERPAMFEVYQSLKSIRGTQDFTKHFDEFPLVYRCDNPNTASIQNSQSSR